MRTTLTDRGVAALKPHAKRRTVADPECRGHYIRVHPSGKKAFYAVTRGPDGKQRWVENGDASVVKIAAARVKAREILSRVHAGLPAVEPKGDTVAAVVANWLKRHVEANGLRTEREIRQLLERDVLSAWGARPFVSIHRSDIASLLDTVEDGHGKRQADKVLTIVRSVMNWHASRTDFNPPTTKGMNRQSLHAQQRGRVLSDNEIRAVWRAADAAGPFGGVVQLCLLTAQRRTKVLRMTWAQIEGSVWTLPYEPREKPNACTLTLPPLAMAVIAKQPRVVGNDHVFAGLRGPLGALGKPKRKLNAASGVSNWVLHDLRRTARSLMSQARVPRDIAERVLGHTIRGVAGVYDRYAYRDEKADALAKLAALIDSIVNPRENVVPLARTR
jgi:integrase